MKKSEIYELRSLFQQILNDFRNDFPRGEIMGRSELISQSVEKGVDICNASLYRKKILNVETLESKKSLIDLFAPRLDKIFEDQYPTKAQIYDALHKSIRDLERT